MALTESRYIDDCKSIYRETISNIDGDNNNDPYALPHMIVTLRFVECRAVKVDILIYVVEQFSLAYKNVNYDDFVE